MLLFSLIQAGTMPKPEKITLYWPRGLFFWRPGPKYAEGYLLKGKRHHTWVFWYKSGQKQLEGEYISGTKTGTWVKWAENGARITEGEFVHGKMHGRWTDWQLNGQKALESQWRMGKRDGTWTYWRMNGSLEKVEHYHYRLEEEKGYSIHTDLEAKEIVRKIQRKNLLRSWERLVGRFIASVVKPWHVACWVLIFVPAFSLMKGRTTWRNVVLAGILAFVITNLLAWSFDRKGNE